MKRTKFSISILVSAIVVSVLARGAVAAEKPVTTKPFEPSAEFKLLHKFVGNWRGVAIIHKTKWNPKEIRWTDALSCVRILGGRFTLSRTAASDGGAIILLTTYDVQRKCYRMWSFHSRGFTSEFTGKWDNETKIFTWRSNDKDVSAVTRSWYADDNTVEWNIEGKDSDGEVTFRTEGKYTRVKELPKRKAAPTTKPAERSAEQKVLDVFVGDWKGTGSVLKAPGNAKAVNLTDASSYVRVLGGRFVRNNTRDSSGRSGFSLTTYDVQRKCYRVWYFDSQGFMVESAGKFDAKTRTLTMLVDHGDGVTTTSKVSVVDNDTFDWGAVTKDRDGNTFYQAKGRNTRLKKPAKKKGG